jgi:hypothetical protein
VAGDISGSLNNTGGGSIMSLLTITSSACSVSGLTLNGEPQHHGQRPNKLQPDGSIVSHNSFGDWRHLLWPESSGSCKFNVTYTVNSATSCTISGTACG